VEDLWAERRIAAVLKKGGIPQEWVESSVTQNYRCVGCSLLLIAGV